MNIDNGSIHMLPDGTTDREALLQRLVPIDLSQATNEQKAQMRVRLDDKSSELGKQLQQWRSKYVPHVGAKERLRAAEQIGNP